MNLIRLILYMIILVVSLYNMISFYYGKKKGKALSAQKLKDMVPLRTLEMKEAEALSKIYKVDVKPGIPVYAVSGEYRCSVLRVRHSATEEAHYIDDILVHPHDGVRQVLPLAQRLEIVNPESKKGALIVSIDEKMTAESEVKILEAVEKGGEYQQTDGEDQTFSVKPGRPLTEEENYHNSGDTRAISSMLILALLAVPTFYTQIYFSLIGLVGASLLFLYFYLPALPKKLTSKEGEVEVFQGTLKQVDSTYMVNRFTLGLPSGADDYLAPGMSVMLEGVIRGANKNFIDVFSVNGHSFIDKKEKKGRHFVTFIGGLILLVVMLAAGKLNLKIENVIDHFLTARLPVEFSGYDEINEYDFKKGQYVELNDLFAVPNLEYDFVDFSGILGGKEGGVLPIDFSPLYEFYNQLEQMQETAEFLNIYSFYVNDMSNYYTIMSLYSSADDSIGLSSFQKDFSSIESSMLFFEMSEVLNNLDENATVDDLIDYPEGGYLLNYLGDTDRSLTLGDLVNYVVSFYDDFFRNQEQVYSDMLEDIIRAYMETQEFVVIRGSRNNVLNHYPSRRSLEKYSEGDNSYSLPPLTINDELPILRELQRFEDQISSSYGPLGMVYGRIISVKDYHNRRIISIEEGPEYSSLYIDMTHILLYLVLFGLVIYGFYRIRNTSNYPF
jgi:hypothetical protein